MTNVVFSQELKDHLERELRRYYPSLTDLEADFYGERIGLNFYIEGCHFLLLQSNASGSDEEWFEFRTESNRTLTLPFPLES